MEKHYDDLRKSLWSLKNHLILENIFAIQDITALDNLEAGIEKIKEYEDLEEDLGIDFITLYKALTGTVYVNYNDKILEVTVDGIDRKYIWFYIRDLGKRIRVCYELKNYGKTWAVNKEKLEGK